jgi:hypothetical protein
MLVGTRRAETKSELTLSCLGNQLGPRRTQVRADRTRHLKSACAADLVSWQEKELSRTQ